MDKGNYCLLIHMKKDSKIKIGAKGFIFFKKGYYVYVGSALNTLSKRIERHLSIDKKIAGDRYEIHGGRRRDNSA